MVLRCVGEASGPISQPATEPVYLDIAVSPDTAWEYPLPEGRSAFAYAFQGNGKLGQGDDARPLAAQQLAVFAGGPVVRIAAGDAGLRHLGI